MNSITKLIDIPGVGKNVSSLLIQYFGSEKAALDAIFGKRIIEIASVPGVGRSKAIRIVRSAVEKQYGVRMVDILKTEDIQKIYFKIIEIISEYAQTEATRAILPLYFPLPSSKKSIIEERLNYFGISKQIINKISSDTLSQILIYLPKLKPLKKEINIRRISERVILTDNENVFQNLQQYSSDITIDLIDKIEMLKDYIHGYNFVSFISKESTYEEKFSNAENLELLENIEEEILLPERIIFFFSSNLSIIRAISKLAEILKPIAKENNVIARILDNFDFDELIDLWQHVSVIDENGNIIEGIDEEIDRYRRVVNSLEMLIAEKELWINETIKEKIGSSDITLDGKQILNILETADEDTIDAEKLKQYLPEEVVEVITNTIEEAEQALIEELDLDLEEATLLTNLFPRDMKLPIEAKLRKIDEVLDYFKKKLYLRKYFILRDLARKLSKVKVKVIKALQALFELDLFLAIGRFAINYDLTIPEISVDYNGITFVDGKNLFLAKQMLENNGKVIPVTYTVGHSPKKIDNTNNENVIILSGANSGGKTTLLQTILQIVILGQMGFPVPAKECYIGLFDQIFYYAKAQGMLDAGAFETSLKRMAELVISETSKLVCFDEWEASTEADAAAKIIASTLDMFFENKRTCVVFVSHLADRIRKLTTASIRIDGIEARGLDENLNLIVDRSPKFNYIAKSMPELIVKRLSKTSSGIEKKVYEKILSTFTDFNKG